MRADDRDEYLSTREAEAYSKLRNLAKRRVQGSHAGPPFIKAGEGRNGKVLYSRRAIDQWLAERTRKSTSDHTVTETRP
jgi:hypothetical protein